MRKFAEAGEHIAGTTKKLEKITIVADYLKSISIEDASVAAIFLSGMPFPAWEETTLQVGGRLLWHVVEELSGKSSQELTAAYRKHGDLGAAAAEVLPSRAKPGSDQEASPAEGSSPSVQEVQAAFRKIAAARGPAAKAILVRELISQVTPLEAKYIVKIVTGDLRIGLKESLVEEGVASPGGNWTKPGCASSIP
jgi:DNA ligase-1